MLGAILVGYGIEDEKISPIWCAASCLPPAQASYTLSALLPREFLLPFEKRRLPQGGDVECKDNDEAEESKPRPYKSV